MIEFDMKRFLTRTALLCVVFMAASCGKESIPSVSPEDLLKDSAEIAWTRISLKGDSGEGSDASASFKTATVYRTSDMEGQSWFSAWSGGKMSYDCFFLSIYFQNIDGMKIGETLKPGRFMFMFPLSSDSDDYTSEYRGKITLAGKGDDYVILEFHEVGFSCGKGDYLIDGYLYCPLEDVFNLPVNEPSNS